MPVPWIALGQASRTAAVMAMPTEPSDQATCVKSRTHCPRKFPLPPPRKRRRAGMGDASPSRFEGLAPAGRLRSEGWRPGVQA
eukprot:6223027-Alexandrium_andersonii.AAC.1